MVVKRTFSVYIASLARRTCRSKWRLFQADNTTTEKYNNCFVKAPSLGSG